MQQAQSHLKGGQHVAPVGVQAGVFLEAGLLQLQVPIAEFVPEEMPEQLRGFVVAILLDGAVHLFGAGIQAAEDPAVFDGDFDAGSGSGRKVSRRLGSHGSTPERSIFTKSRRAAFQILLAKARVAFHAVFGEHDVGAGRGAQQQRHAHGVGAVLFGDHQRVDGVAAGLGHFLALGVAHQAVNVDLRKGTRP
jgi:hypothetical protein